MKLKDVQKEIDLRQQSNRIKYTIYTMIQNVIEYGFNNIIELFGPIVACERMGYSSITHPFIKKLFEL